ncbi:hypothetical protein FACS189416_2140 [Bacteroidia bacterium]|nr:hypothetical protein FACS189416_2140 [Bacteroidia bacterium]
MNIGILTYHWVPNFGANLQTLATVSYLRNNGYTPIVINWIPEDCKKSYEKITPKTQFEAHKVFQERFFTCTEECENDDDIINAIKNNSIEAIIIGSDSLFNLLKPSFNIRRLKVIHPTSDHSFPNPFWGSFPSGNIPISGLSISSQNSKYYKFSDMKNSIKDALMNFRYLSVRDSWTQKLVIDMTDGICKPIVTPDPVFSFNDNKPPFISKEVICNKFNLPEKYFLLSFSNNIRFSISDKWIKEFVELSNSELITCVSLPSPNGSHVNILNCQIPLPLSPLEWYYLIKYSQGYIGRLMHPIIVSLHNSVPFFSFDHYGILTAQLFINKKSSKIYNILERADLLDNYYNIYSFAKKPSPKTVFSKIMSFDKKKCTKFALKQSKLCELNFKTVIDSLIS